MLHHLLPFSGLFSDHHDFRLLSLPDLWEQLSNNKARRNPGIKKAPADNHQQMLK